MNYNEFSQKTASNKLILARIRSVVKASVFNGLSRKEKFNVVAVKINGVDSPFTFDSSSMILTFSEDPIGKEVFITYEHCFSNMGINASIGGSFPVNFDSRLRQIGELNLELDYENTGIALETNSSLVLENGDGYFDSFFDKHIWENQSCEFYSWSKELPESEAKLIYSGLVKDKSFTEKTVTFTLTDNLFKLREKIVLPKFQEIEYFPGKTVSSMVGKEKTLIFGKVDKLKTTSISAQNDGVEYPFPISVSSDQNVLPGTFSGAKDSFIITASSPVFIPSNVLVEEELRVIIGTKEYDFKVEEILSTSQIRVTDPIEEGFASLSLRNISRKSNLVTILSLDGESLQLLSPGDEVMIFGKEYKIEFVGENSFLTTESLEATGQTLFTYKSDFPSRELNRFHNISGFPLVSGSFTVTEVISPIAIRMTNADLLNAGDVLYDQLFGVSSSTVKRVKDGIVYFNSSLPYAKPGSVFKRSSVFKAHLRDTELVFQRDFGTLSSNILALSNLVEFNLAPVISGATKLKIDPLNNRRLIKETGDETDLSTLFKTRDWLRVSKQGQDKWYEVLNVNKDFIDLREPFIGQANTFNYLQKSPEYIKDDTLIRVDCYGLYDGKWIKTAKDAVKWLVKDLGEFNDVDDFSFDFPLSIYFPGSSVPSIRDAVSLINQSCFGSLYQDNAFRFNFRVLDADRPETLEVLGDDDIISFKQSTKNNIVSKVVLNYAPYTDENGSEQFKTIEAVNTEVINSTGNNNTLTVTSYVYDQAVAENIANRWLFYRGQNQSIVTIQAKLNLVLKALNDVVGIKLRRLFTRYGSNDRVKIGIINSISKDGLSTEIQFNDIGNVFNRVPGIASNSSNDFNNASDLELALNGYIVDNLTETPNNNEDELGSNLIG